MQLALNIVVVVLTSLSKPFVPPLCICSRSLLLPSPFSLLSPLPSNLQVDNIELKSNIRKVEGGTVFADVFERYESDIEKLGRDNRELQGEVTELYAANTELPVAVMDMISSGTYCSPLIVCLPRGWPQNLGTKRVPWQEQLWHRRPSIAG